MIQSWLLLHIIYRRSFSFWVNLCAKLRKKLKATNMIVELIQGKSNNNFLLISDRLTITYAE